MLMAEKASTTTQSDLFVTSRIASDDDEHQERGGQEAAAVSSTPILPSELKEVSSNISIMSAMSSGFTTPIAEEEELRGGGWEQIAPAAVIAAAILEEEARRKDDDDAEEHEEERGRSGSIASSTSSSLAVVLREDLCDHDKEEEGEEEGEGGGRDDASFSTATSSPTDEDLGIPRQIIDRWGFIVNTIEKRTSKEEKIRLQQVAKETARSIKWLKMLKDWHKYETKETTKVKKRIRKGIPDVVRRQAWGHMLGLEEEMKKEPKLYQELCERTDVPDQEIHNTIERDIDRTFPRHVFFRDHGAGQDRLRRVLQAYSRLDTEVGYCQGMGFITAMLLTYFPEDEAFYMLHTVMMKRPAPIRGLYLPGMPKAREMIYVGDCLTKQFLPALHRHLTQQNVDPSMYVTQWFVTIYTNCFPFEVVTRVWDTFLAEGWKIVYRVQLAILKTNEKALLSRDFEKIMEYFKQVPKTVTPQVLDLAFTLPLKRKQIVMYTEEFLKDNPELSVQI